ncbi:MAG: ferritin-like domain-containing protein [Acidimicrobiales bacterium]
MSENLEHQMEENASLLQRLAPSPLSRRRVLLGGGVGALALVAAACGSDNEEPGATGESTTTTAATGGGGGEGGGDVATAKLAAGLEVLAVNTYGAALKAPLDYPPAVAEFATTVQGHHQEALDAWNNVLTTLGEAEVTTPPASLEGTINDMFAQVTDVPGVAMLALLLEQTAADTYFSAIPTIMNKDALKLAATIQPIDMQHAAILHYVLGEYPVPNTFANADKAYSG